MSSSSSSHLMKTTRRGRPFVKVSKGLRAHGGDARPHSEHSNSPLLQDTHDLFATLIVSLRLENHRSFFKTFPNSFTTCVFGDRVAVSPSRVDGGLLYCCRRHGTKDTANCCWFSPGKRSRLATRATATPLPSPSAYSHLLTNVADQP